MALALPAMVAGGPVGFLEPAIVAGENMVGTIKHYQYMVVQCYNLIHLGHMTL